jgi:hypothetical protein
MAPSIKITYVDGWMGLRYRFSAEAAYYSICHAVAFLIASWPHLPRALEAEGNVTKRGTERCVISELVESSAETEKALIAQTKTSPHNGSEHHFAETNISPPPSPSPSFDSCIRQAFGLRHAL